MADALVLFDELVASGGEDATQTKGEFIPARLAESTLCGGTASPTPIMLTANSLQQMQHSARRRLVLKPGGSVFEVVRK